MGRGRICSFETVATKRETGESLVLFSSPLSAVPLPLLMFVVFLLFFPVLLSFYFCCCTRWSLSGKTRGAHWVGNLVQSAIWSVVDFGWEMGEEGGMP